MLCPRKLLFGPTIVCRHLASYIQGQSPSPKKREYFYFIDHQGQLFLDDAKIKNFITCFKDKKFLAFFFRRIKPNKTGRYEDKFPFVSPCGPETNYIRCDDLPIVFTHLLDQEGNIIENIEMYGVTKSVKHPTGGVSGDSLKHSERKSLEVETAGSSTEKLSYGGTGNILTIPFEPDKLCMFPDSGRVYHTGLHNLGAVGLVKSSLAFELSRFFEYGDGAKESESPTAFKWRGRRYKLDNSVFTAKQ